VLGTDPRTIPSGEKRTTTGQGILSACTTDLRRLLAFRRKVRAAGLRIVGPDWTPIEAIRIPRPDAWFAGQSESPWRTVFDTPHYKLLTVQHGTWWNLRETDYWAWQRSIRGLDHSRPDDWIAAMAERLKRLQSSIHGEGYRLRSVADRIAVMEGGTLWDGGHRLACLAAEGWVLVPVVVVRSND